MKMKRFVTAAVALLLMVSLVGTGFSYWFFNSYTSIVSCDDLTMEVTQLIAVGDIIAADSFKLSFDQTKQPTGSALTKYTTNGIKAVFDTDAKTGATYTSPSEAVDTVNGQVTYDFIVTMNISDDLAKYFTATTTQTGWTANKESNEIIFTGNEQTTFNWENVTFYYATAEGKNQEPTNIGELNAMRDAVTKGKISVVYTVTLRDVSANS